MALTPNQRTHPDVRAKAIERRTEYTTSGEEEKINVPEQKSINVRDFLSFSLLQRDPLLFLNFSCGYQDRKVSFSLGREEHTAAFGSLFVWEYVRAGGGEIGVERNEVLHSSWPQSCGFMSFVWYTAYHIRKILTWKMAKERAIDVCMCSGRMWAMRWKMVKNKGIILMPQHLISHWPHDLGLLSFIYYVIIDKCLGLMALFTAALHSGLQLRHYCA